MCYAKKIIIGIFFYGSFINVTSAQQQIQLDKFRQERANADRLQAHEIEAYLKLPDSIRLKTQISHPAFLLAGISKLGKPIYKSILNAGAATTTGVTRLQDLSTGLNLQGENILVGIWDDGFVKDHVELGNRVISKEGTSAQMHATHVTGTIMATGINPAAKGMAPKAKATTWYFDNDEAEMASLAKSDQGGLLFSNHSYGTVTGWTRVNGIWRWTGDPTISNDEDYRHGFYGESAQTLDQITYLSPYYTIVWAAGNDRTEVGDGSHPPDGNGGTGYDCIIPQAVAKNIITVGAINKVSSYNGPSSVVMSPFSSWGPTDDGRIKPDLVAAGVSLFSITSAGTDQYATASGTSMATPNVTGSLVLLQELYSKLHGGNFMKASTLKSLSIHTAKDAGLYDGPDYNYGWGLLDVAAAAKLILQEDNENVLIKELSLGNGQTYTQDLYSQADQKITVTICWTDPPGTPTNDSLDPPDKMLVNDLDVRLVDLSNNLQYPWILNPASPSSRATTGDNSRDNVEKIEFSTPAAARYTILVSHKGQLLNGKQDFSLIVTYKSSLKTGSTLYWVGNSGDWNSGAHWSLTTGGTPANVIPTAVDDVVFDENSFDGVQLRTVNLTADAACKKITWLTDKPSALALNNYLLKAAGSFSINAKNFMISSSGILRFEAPANTYCSLNILKADLTKAAFEFNGGNWTAFGNLAVRKVEVKKGSFAVKSTYASMRELNALSNTALDLGGNNVDSLQQSCIDKTVVFTSTNSSFNFSAASKLLWDNVNYQGTITVAENATLEISGSNTFKSLVLNKGSLLSLSATTTQNISALTLNSVNGGTITLQSTGKAAINFLTHNRKCFDYLSVTNVDVTGNAMVCAGMHSSVTNSVNWHQTKCDDVLFSDFAVSNTCLNSLTMFQDKSLGKASSWLWDFGDDTADNNGSTKQNPYHKFSKSGTFIVTLKVSDGATDHSFSKPVTISTTGLPDNDIVVNGSSLFSFQLSDSYQWFKDGEPIAGANARSYPYQGQTGSFAVVVSADDCNNISSPFVVTALENNLFLVQLSPNPAQDHVVLRLSTVPAHVIITDILGRSVLNQSIADTETLLDLKDLQDGVYVLQVQSPSFTVKRRIVIQQ